MVLVHVLCVDHILHTHPAVPTCKLLYRNAVCACGVHVYIVCGVCVHVYMWCVCACVYVCVHMLASV